MDTNGTVLAILGGALDGDTTFAVAVQQDGTTTERRATRGARVELAALVERTLAAAGTSADRIRAIRVDRGPGSYVGLRVAVTFARTLAAFGGAALEVADSTAVAAAARFRADAAQPERLVVLLDGRQARVQFAAYAMERRRLLELAPPTLWTDDEAMARLRPGDVVAADPDVSARLAARIEAAGARWEPVLGASAAPLLFAELPIVATPPEALEPLYLTGSYVDGTGGR